MSDNFDFKSLFEGDNDEFTPFGKVIRNYDTIGIIPYLFPRFYNNQIANEFVTWFTCN